MALDNGLPMNDGEWTRYTPSGSTLSVALARQPLIYVNGMNTAAEEHRTAALMFANELSHSVRGCYNQCGLSGTIQVRNLLNGAQTALRSPYLPADLRIKLEAIFAVANAGNSLLGFLADVEQCLDDWSSPFRRNLVQAAPTAAGSGLIQLEVAALTTALGPLFGPLIGHAIQQKTADALKAIVIPEAAKTQLKVGIAKAMLSSNACALSLFNELGKMIGRTQTVRILCHSQGNLIVSNVLSFLLWAHRSLPAKLFRVFGLASPVNALGWPSGINLKLYTNADDFVTWLSLGRSYGGAQVFSQGSGIAAHDIALYNRQPQFLRDVQLEFGITR